VSPGRLIRAIVALPGVVTILIPALIVSGSREIRLGGPLSGPARLLPISLGSALIGLGLWLLYKTISLFASRGQGTLAPWDPPRHFVVRGIYRRTRNPMISGIFSILLGESVLLGSGGLFGWFLVVAGVNTLYIPLLEEPQLAQRFGDEYELYRRHVPRWIPRRQPWQAPWDQQAQ
jgi:protein-S-isoprenylcysteine O-methyltransferase Ste14